MKLIKATLTGVIALTLVIAQCGDPGPGGGQPPQGPPPCDPDVEYPVAYPGPDGGCANYNDCNGNGAYDVGEPCADGGPDPVGDAYFGSLENGATPEEAFNAAAGVVYDLEVVNGEMTEEEYNDGKAKAEQAFQEALANGATPEEAFGAAMAAAEGPPPGMEGSGFYCGECDMHFADQAEMDQHIADHHSSSDAPGMGPAAPTNHWDGNCAAICGGHGEYWLDSDGDGQAEDGPYASWDHDADGNPVDCGCGPDDPPFEDVDANGDGVIDREEARAFFGHEPDFDQKFDEIDTNGDGVVDHPEFEAEGSGQGPDGDYQGGGEPMNLDDWLNSDAAHDLNGDGSIDVEDFDVDHPDPGTAYCDGDGVDNDGDGMIDEQRERCPQ